MKADGEQAAGWNARVQAESRIADAIWRHRGQTASQYKATQDACYFHSEEF